MFVLCRPAETFKAEIMFRVKRHVCWVQSHVSRGQPGTFLCLELRSTLHCADHSLQFRCRKAHLSRSRFKSQHLRRGGLIQIPPWDLIKIHTRLSMLQTIVTLLFSYVPNRRLVSIRNSCRNHAKFEIRIFKEARFFSLCFRLGVKLLLVRLHVDATLQLSAGSADLEANNALLNRLVQLLEAADTSVLHGVLQASSQVWHELANGTTKFLC